jgi:hypothetical protein
LDQAVENVIDNSPRWNVQQHHARRLQLLAKRGDVRNLDKTRLLELVARAIAGQTHDAHSSFERLEGESTAHLAKTDYTQFADVCHTRRCSLPILGTWWSAPQNECLHGHHPCSSLAMPLH